MKALAIFEGVNYFDNLHMIAVDINVNSNPKDNDFDTSLYENDAREKLEYVPESISQIELPSAKLSFISEYDSKVKKGEWFEVNKSLRNDLVDRRMCRYYKTKTFIDMVGLSLPLNVQLELRKKYDKSGDVEVKIKCEYLASEELRGLLYKVDSYNHLIQKERRKLYESESVHKDLIDLVFKRVN